MFVEFLLVCFGISCKLKGGSRGGGLKLKSVFLRMILETCSTCMKVVLKFNYYMYVDIGELLHKGGWCDFLSRPFHHFFGIAM